MPIFFRENRERLGRNLSIIIKYSMTRMTRSWRLTLTPVAAAVAAFLTPQRGQLLLLATRLVLRTGALYGRYLDLKKGEPPSCPICQDPCSCPIKLDCTHVSRARARGAARLQLPCLKLASARCHLNARASP